VKAGRSLPSGLMQWFWSVVAARLKCRFASALFRIEIAHEMRAIMHNLKKDF
jgi:hypothetical protein